jgi:hypothetical protein
MRQVHATGALLALALYGLFGQAQQTVSTNTNVAVPPLVNFSGVLTDVSGKPLTGVIGVTFCLYKEEQGGSPLWMETQNVTPDKTGHYSVMLGSTSSTGLPSDIFAAGEAHWLGVQVQVQGQEEQSRVLLVSAPYALKAGDAETVGGLPASAFVLAVPAAKNATGNAPYYNSTTASGDGSRHGSRKAAASPFASSDVTTTGGTVNTLPLFTTTSNIQNSLLTQTGTTGINLAGTLNVTNTTTMSGTSSSGELQVTNTATSGAAPAVVGTTKSTIAAALKGVASATTGSNNGVLGTSDSSAGFGVKGTSPNVGVYGTTSGTGATNYGVEGNATSTSGAGAGVYGTTNSAGGYGVLGAASSTSYFTAGVLGTSSSTLGFGVEGTSPNLGVYGTASSTLAIAGVYGETLATDGSAPGVYGSTNGSGDGVYGYTNGYGAGVYGNSEYGDGVYGNSAYSGVVGLGIPNSVYPFSVGVEGAYNCCSVLGGDLGYAAGVWADSGDGGYEALVASADNTAAGLFENNSSSSPTVSVYNDASSGDVFVLGSGYNDTSCIIDVSGDLICTGSDSAVVPVDGGARRVALYAVEAPENWLEDAGSARLSHGSAHIEIESIFGQTVNSELEYHVFLTPKGDCDGLYVSNETSRGFEVHELRGGTSNIAFDYRIMAKRRGYESIRLADETEHFKHIRAQREQRLKNAKEHAGKRRAQQAPPVPKPLPARLPGHMAAVVLQQK